MSVDGTNVGIIAAIEIILAARIVQRVGHGRTGREQFADRRRPDRAGIDAAEGQSFPDPAELRRDSPACGPGDRAARNRMIDIADRTVKFGAADQRSEEHTPELQSLMRIPYAVFGLNTKTNKKIANTKTEK